MTLDDLLEAVKDQESFLVFARALQADKEDETGKEKETQASIRPWLERLAKFI